MRSQSILFLTDTLTNYQYEFFDKINKFHNIKFFVINKKKYKNYNFVFPKRKYIIFLEKLNKIKPNIKKILIQNDINKIVFCGYRLKYISYLKKIATSNKIKFFYWLERINPQSKLKIFILTKLFKVILNRAKEIFENVKAAKKYYSKFNNNVFNIPYSININQKSLKKTSGKLKFLFVGQLIKRKSVDVIIKTLSKLSSKQRKSMEFTMIGNGPLKGKIKNLVKKYKSIKYEKFVNDKKLKTYYQKSHILIFPSKFDGWGVVPLQAMSNSMFLILGKNCGVNEILKPIGKNHIITPSENEIKNSIDYCLKNKKVILNQGKVNKMILAKSQCNSENLIRRFNRVINLN